MMKFVFKILSLFITKINKIITIEHLIHASFKFIIFISMFIIFNHFHFFDSIFPTNYPETGGAYSKSATPSPDNSPASGHYRTTAQILDLKPEEMTGLLETAKNASPHYILKTNHDLTDSASANYFDVYANNEKHMNECKKK